MQEDDLASLMPTTTTTTSLINALSPTLTKPQQGPPMHTITTTTNNNSPPCRMVSLDPVDALLMELQQDDCYDDNDAHYDPLLASMGFLLNNDNNNQEPQSDYALGRRLDQILNDTLPW